MRVSDPCRRLGGVAPRERVPLSFAHDPLPILQQLEDGAVLHGEPPLLGSETAVEPISVAAALRDFAQRHEALRTVPPELVRAEEGV